MNPYILGLQVTKVQDQIVFIALEFLCISNNLLIHHLKTEIL